MPKSALTVDYVLRILKRRYPDADCTLDWKTPLQLLVAVILAAQCTDARVNQVTKALFKKYRKPEDYLAVPSAELESDIFPCGTYRMKARAIRESCHVILTRFGGNVPRTMAEMLQLRGVGRKSAAVVLGTAFGVIDGIPIDTHNIRVLRRLGVTRERTQARIELDMMRKTPRKDWLQLSHLMVAHGRAVCTARNRACHRCPFAQECPSSMVLGKKDQA